MGNFFKYAPARDTHQKRFLEAVTNRKNVVASFPLGYSTVSLYAFASMLGGGLVVAVCPSARHIRRNLDYFKTAGFKFPDVAFLDGTQMPHEERAIQKEVNHNRVRLLYTTPERFCSLTFLEILVHAQVNFMVIEEADRFLPQTPGYSIYRQFQEQGLDQLRKLPPLALMTPPLPSVRLREIGARLDLGDYYPIQCVPSLESVGLDVRALVTEHQKFTVMTDVMAGSPGYGKLGRLDEPGAVLIQAAYPAQAEKLGASLLDYGFESVWITHFKKPMREQIHVLDMANSRQHSIVVNADSDMRYWQPPPGVGRRLFFWSPPLGMDDLLMQVCRQTPPVQDAYGQLQSLQAMILYTKEDFQAAANRLQSNRHLSDEEVRERMRALKHYRRWMLSDGCRLQTLLSYYEGRSAVEAPPCGQCDRCLNKNRRYPVAQNLLNRWLQHWFY